MAMVSRAKRRVLEEEEEDDEEELDHISSLPDGVLGDIVSLLPTKDDARTQVLSSRWRHIWRSAPLNLALDPNPNDSFGATHVTACLISRIVSSHQGPGRRFSIPKTYFFCRALVATSLDGWLELPALDGLQELEFHYYTPYGWMAALPPPPESLHCFSSTLHVASLGGCGFPDGNNASGLQFTVLRQLSLSDVRFSERSLRALLAACPVLQSLLLTGTVGFPRVQISCPTLRSIGVRTDYGPYRLQQLIIEDAPCLERLLCFDSNDIGITISVISAPKLHVLGHLSAHSPIFEFGSTVFQGSGWGQHHIWSVAREKECTAVISIIFGQANGKDVEKQFTNLRGTETWRWSARPAGDNKYLMRFPTAQMVKEWSFFPAMTMRFVNAQMKIEQYTSSFGAQGELQQAWFRVWGIPPEQRAIITCAKVGGLVGKVFEIDERTRLRGDYVRMKICCMDVSRVPSTAVSTLGRVFHKFTYEREVEIEPPVRTLKSGVVVNEGGKPPPPKKLKPESSETGTGSNSGGTSGTKNLSMSAPPKYKSNSVDFGKTAVHTNAGGAKMDDTHNSDKFDDLECEEDLEDRIRKLDGFGDFGQGSSVDISNATQC